MYNLKTFVQNYFPKISSSFKISFLLLAAMLFLPNLVQAEFQYRVKVKTGHKGTDADITILLIGTKGVIEDYFLMDNPDRNDFWPNTEDVFIIYSQKDIGIVTDVKIRPRGGGLSIDHWKMEYITVENLQYPNKITRFTHTPIISLSPSDKDLKLRATKYKVRPTVTEGVEKNILDDKKMFSYNNFSGHENEEHSEEVSIANTESYSESTSNSVSTKNAWSIEAKVSFGDGIVFPESEVTTTYAGEITDEFTKAAERNQSRKYVSTKTAPFIAEKCAMTFYALPIEHVQVYGVFEDGFDEEIKFTKSEGNNLLFNRKDKWVFRAVDDTANGCSNCPSFQELWQKARPGVSAPTGPKLADRARLATTDVCYIPSVTEPTPPVVTPTATTPPVVTTTTPPVNISPPAENNPPVVSNPPTNTSPPTSIPTATTVSNKYVCIQNNWKKDQFIHNENGKVEAGKIQPNWWSSQWKLIPASSGYVTIQNKYKPTHYLHNEHGKIEEGVIQPNWWSSQWKIIPAHSGWVRIQNKYKPNEYLHIQNGKIEVGPIDNNWASALWKVE